MLILQERMFDYFPSVFLPRNEGGKPKVTAVGRETKQIRHSTTRYQFRGLDRVVYSHELNIFFTTAPGSLHTKLSGSQGTSGVYPWVCHFRYRSCAHPLVLFFLYDLAGECAIDFLFFHDPPLSVTFLLMVLLKLHSIALSEEFVYIAAHMV